jgi:hypothetical protein
MLEILFGLEGSMEGRSSMVLPLSIFSKHAKVRGNAAEILNFLGFFPSKGIPCIGLANTFQGDATLNFPKLGFPPLFSPKGRVLPSPPLVG